MLDISVVIPAFNAEASIARAVESGLRLPNAKVIVVDDGSTDRTAELAESAGAVVIRQANSGASAARAAGLERVTTSLVVLLDSDDELVEAGVTRSIQILTSDESLVAVGGRVIGVSPKGFERLLPRNYSEVTARSLVKTGYGPWPPAAAVLRVSKLLQSRDVAPQPTRTRYAEDFDLIIRLAIVGRIAMHDEVSARYSMFSGKSSRLPIQSIRDKEAIRSHYGDALGIDFTPLSESGIRSAAFGKAARAQLARGNVLGGAFLSFKAVLADPKKVLGRLARPAAPGSGVRRAHLWATGQDDNIGDSLLRRPYLHTLRGIAPVDVWVRDASPEFIAGLGTEAGDRVFRSWIRWYVTAAWSATRGHAIIAINAGEMAVSGRGAAKLAMLIPVLSIARFRKGAAVWLGAGIPSPGRPAFLAVYRVAARACSMVSWRERGSVSVARSGEVAPDWAFIEGSAVSDWSDLASRDLLTVVLRGDRPYPPAEWWQWVRATAHALQLTPTLIVQVRRDSEYAERARSELGFGVIEWEEGADHRAQETLVRSQFARSALTIGDRLHGLIVAASEGSVPIGWVASSRGKVARHFTTVGLTFTGEHEGSDVSQYGGLAPEDLTEFRSQLESALSDARADLADRARRLQPL